jgi:hypothetical protein
VIALGFAVLLAYAAHARLVVAVLAKRRGVVRATPAPYDTGVWP